jgi:hypothetical protein
MKWPGSGTSSSPRTPTRRRGSGKGGKRREAGMDSGAGNNCDSGCPAALPPGPLFCVSPGPPTAGPGNISAARRRPRQLTVQAGVRRRFAPRAASRSCHRDGPTSTPSPSGPRSVTPAGKASPRETSGLIAAPHGQQRRRRNTRADGEVPGSRRHACGRWLETPQPHATDQSPETLLDDRTPCGLRRLLDHRRHGRGPAAGCAPRPALLNPRESRNAG